MIYDRTSLLMLTCPCDWDGQPMAEDGYIGLRSLAFNLSSWEAGAQLNSIKIIDGKQLIIRREGRHIYIERPWGFIGDEHEPR